MSKTLSLIFRFAARDWRGGELGLLLAALIIAVSSIAAVGFFVDRLRVALESQAAELLGADLIVRSSRELPPTYAEEALRRGLKIARTVEFPSMVSAGELPRLASVKAFDPGYPLRGHPRVFVQGSAGETIAAPLPGAGEVWADPQLVNSLDARDGATLTLGESTFRLTAQIALEPDRGGGFVNFAPRILVPLENLAATGLVQPGSRVSHRLMVAGSDRAQVDAFAGWLRTRLGAAERLETVDDGRPELRTTLDRAEQFLSLVALLSALIAAVAVALAARRFAVRHLDTCAVVKALGMTQAELLQVLVGELLLLAVAGGLVGAVIGYGVHFLLAQAIAPLMAIALPGPSAWPALQAVLASLILLVGFGAWPFVRLADVSPLRVLRRDIQGAPAQAWVGLVLAALSFTALLFWLSSDRRLAAYALGGFAVGMVVFALLGWLLVVAVGRLRHWRGLARRPVLRMALASWSRRRGTAVAQTVALSVGLMALVLLSVTRTDLIDGWRRATPADAPNRFLVNIQPGQQDRVREVLGGHGVGQVPLYPMIRGRLVQINERPAAEAVEDAGHEMAQRSLQRELNLSYLAALPGHNQLVSGKWLDPQAAEVSVEEGLARSFGLSLGDRLAFDIAGESITATVTSLRKVSWDSMKVNFFMILSPSLMADLPQTWISAYHQPVGDVADRDLLRAMPNLTVFDTGQILAQIQAMLGQVVKAVQFLFVLTLAAGITVLYGALASSRDERMREAGLMRALGASSRQLSRAQVWELALTGALAGLLAAVGALAVGAVLADRVFQFELATRWSVLPLGLVGGGLLAVVAGWMGLRPVLAAAPMVTLRNA